MQETETGSQASHVSRGARVLLLAGLSLPCLLLLLQIASLLGLGAALAAAVVDRSHQHCVIPAFLLSREDGVDGGSTCVSDQHGGVTLCLLRQCT